MSKTDVDAGGCAAPYLKALKKQPGAYKPAPHSDNDLKGVLAQLCQERYA